MNERICSNCKKNISEHSEKEFLSCTQKIMKDLLLAEENRRRMKQKQKDKKS